TELTGWLGHVRERYEYDVYGQPTIRDNAGTVLTALAYGNRFLFQGRDRDPDTGLYNFRFRTDSPTLGRFLQVDPIRELGGWNFYSFVFNAPANRMDPTGLIGPVPFNWSPPQPQGPCPCGEAVAQVLAVGLLDPWTAWRLAQEAQLAATASNLPGIEGGPADAFRHCLWSCRMAQEIGRERAKAVGDIHERCGRNRPAAEAMDLANNAIGIGLGTPGADCRSLCHQAAVDGTLQISLPRMNPARPN
ncbi:MAG: RHS repeat domain-containing protein, partial [Limisphaerales bacterium]